MERGPCSHRIFFRTALLTFFSSATMTPRPEEALVSSWHDGDIAFTAAGVSLLPRFVVQVPRSVPQTRLLTV